LEKEKKKCRVHRVFHHRTLKATRTNTRRPNKGERETRQKTPLRYQTVVKLDLISTGNNANTA